MEAFQKIFFAGIIVSVAVLGSRFGGAASVDRSPADASPGFTAAGSAALLGTAADIAESSSADVQVSAAGRNDTSNSAGTSTLPAFYRSGTEPAPVIQAHAALVADLETGAPYLELNAGYRWPMASITKLMTAALAARSMNQEKILTLGLADFPGDEGGAADFFKPGLSYSVGDVEKVMLVLSKNEAAEALANSYGRSQFIGGLNKLAVEWGLASTHFSDPTGLSVANQSIASDIAAIAFHVYRDYADIFAVTRLKKAVITEAISKKSFTLSNINEFAGRPDFLGGKTGYTDEAGGNLVSIFSYGRRPVIIVVLGADDRFGETERLFEWFKNNFRASN